MIYIFCIYEYLGYIVTVWIDGFSESDACFAQSGNRPAHHQQHL